MSNHPNDDLFEETKMSFGSHLEELRVSLFRAVAGLIIGFLIGLLLATQVVGWITTPLEKALNKYHIQNRIEEYKKEFGKKPSPATVAFMTDYQFVYEEIYLEADELARITGQNPGSKPLDVSTATLKEDSKLPPPTTKMYKTRMWRPIDASLTALSAQEVFMIWLKAAFISGMIVASPWIFYQIWMFVAAGLYPHEKKQVFVFLPISLLLFLAGAGLAFFFVFEPVLDFLFSFNRAMQIDPDPRISEWISFVLFLPLGFGVAFQLPLVMVFINRIGIISVSTFIEKWRIAILVIFVISMVLTPADPISMLLMAAPLSVLYFLGIGMCKWMPKGRSQFEEGYDPGE
jgi:sec-independent protein translocase protein TatC